MRAERLALAAALAFGSPRTARAQNAPAAEISADGFTLDDALRAARGSLRVAPTRSLLRAAEADAAAAGRWSNPQLGVTYMRSFGFTTFDPELGVPQVGVTQMIETANVPGRRRRAAEGERAAAGLEVQRTQRSIELRVASSFVRLAAATARRELLRGALSRTAALASLVDARVSAGAAPGYERTRAALALTDARASLGDAEGDVAEARAELDVEVGPAAPSLRGDPRAELAEEPSLPPLNALLEGLPDSRVELQIAGARAEVARARVEVARAEVMPGFALYGGLLAGQGYGERGERQVDFMVGVTVPLPVVNSGRDAVRAAEARAAAAREQAEAELVEARVRVEGAWRVAQRRRATFAENTRAAAELDRLLEESSVAYREGRITLHALIDAHDAVRDARLRALNLAADAHEAVAVLWDAVGRLPRRAPLPSR